MKAYELSKETMEKLRKDSMELIQKHEEGYDTRTILKDMYCGFYSDKTEDIGYMMADKVIEYVEEYEQEVVQARENMDGWYDEKLQKILEGEESCEGRCNTLYKVRVGMVAAELSASEGQEAAEAYVKEHSGRLFTAEEATEELEEKLKNELRDTLGNSGLLASALDAYADKAADTEDDIEHAVIRYGEDASKFKAVAAMKTYLESGEDGYLADAIPAEATLKDITYSTCVGIDTLSVAAAVESGEMEESTASGIIHAIGMVVGGLIALKIAAIIGGALIVVGAGSILAFVSGIVVSVAVLNVIGKVLMEAGGTVADTTKDIVCFGAKCVSFVGKKIFSGIKRVAGFISGLFRRDNDNNDIEEIIDYTEPEQEVDQEIEPEVMPAQNVLA